MQGELVLIMPRCAERAKRERLDRALNTALAGVRISGTVEFAHNLQPITGKRLLFAVALGESGVNLEYYAMLKQLRLNPDYLQGCVGAALIDGQSELYTKYIARELVFTANQCGAAFIGRPLVEATGSLKNFNVIARLTGTDELTSYHDSVCGLVRRLLTHDAALHSARRILALHASSRHSSNTLDLWDLVKGGLPQSEIREIGLRNGEVADCAGCPYTTCLHFQKQGGCFYGGVMVSEVSPAMAWCDTLLLLCPNYNDALSANMTAFINRMTGLFHIQQFYDKLLYAIIVSGYSGSDIVAGQLIAALNMNKTFFLPPRFALIETANDAGSALKLPGVEQRAAAFAARIAAYS